MHLIVFALLASLLTASGGGAAPVEDRPVGEIHPHVEYALEQVPGGIAVGERVAYWPELDMTLEVQAVAARAVGTCATGSVCAYSAANRGGTKLQWGSCGTHSTAAIATVGSIANARSSGTLNARQGTTVRASASAGSSANVPAAYTSGITNVAC